MTDTIQDVNTYAQNLLEELARSGIQKAADGLSSMAGKMCIAATPEICYVDILELPNLLGSLEEEVVGIYLRVWSDLPVQFILLLPHQQAMSLADMLMFQPVGTTTSLDSLSQSALAEVGNLTSSMFLNAIANVTDLPLRPSTPGVMLFQTAFEFPEENCRLDFWAIPNQKTVQSIIDVIEKS